MRLIRRLPLTVLVLALGASACSDSSTQPAVTPAATLNSALTEMSVSSVVPASVSASAGASSVPSAPMLPANCAFAATSQSFVCAPVTTNGVTINSSFALLTSAGTPQSAFDPASTAAVRSTMSLDGTITGAAETVHIDGQHTLTLSGLLTGVHTLDGSQVAHITSTRTGATTSSTLTITTTLAGVVLPEHGSATRYPRAGTVTVASSGHAANGVIVPDITVAMTFNGTSSADVTLSIGDRTQHCTVDLAGGAAGLACS